MGPRTRGGAGCAGAGAAATFGRFAWEAGVGTGAGAVVGAAIIAGFATGAAAGRGFGAATPSDWAGEIVPIHQNKEITIVTAISVAAADPTSSAILSARRQRPPWPSIAIGVSSFGIQVSLYTNRSRDSNPLKGRCAFSFSL